MGLRPCLRCSVIIGVTCRTGARDSSRVTGIVWQRLPPPADRFAPGRPRSTDRTVGGQEITVVVPGEQRKPSTVFEALENANALAHGDLPIPSA